MELIRASPKALTISFELLCRVSIFRRPRRRHLKTKIGQMGMEGLPADRRMIAGAG